MKQVIQFDSRAPNYRCTRWNGSGRIIRLDDRIKRMRKSTRNFYKLMLLLPLAFLSSFVCPSAAFSLLVLPSKYSSTSSFSCTVQLNLAQLSSQEQPNKQAAKEEEEEEIHPQEQQKGNNTIRTIRFRARVAYDGSGYNGFQYQGNQKMRGGTTRTVQGELEAVLARRFNTKNYCNDEKEERDETFLIRVVAAGRTDAGVHARGQAIHFDLLQDIVTKQNLNESGQIQQLQYALNRMLPPDIRIWNVGLVPHPTTVVGATSYYPKRWDVMFETTGKLYSYRICIGPVMDPLARHSRWHVPTNGRPVNPSRLETLLKYFVGTHDFRAFANNREPHQQLVDTIRTVYSIRLIDEEEEGNYRIDVHLKGALYKMVRNMVGTAIEASRENGKKKQRLLDEDEFLKLLNKNRMQNGDVLTRDDNPCKPAPAQGLTLEWVYYEDDEDF